MKHYVYLAGPIAGQTYAGATSWRDFASSSLNSEKIECLSPMRGKDFLRNDEVLAPINANPPVIATEKGINRRDFFDCTRADCLLVYFPASEKASIGTAMEIAWAFQAQIPVVRVMNKPNVHDHPMLNDCVTYTVDTLGEAIELIKFLFNDLGSFTKPKSHAEYEKDRSDVRMGDSV